MHEQRADARRERRDERAPCVHAPVTPEIRRDDARSVRAYVRRAGEICGDCQRERQRRARLREHRVQACLPRGEVQAARGACALRGVCGQGDGQRAGVRRGGCDEGVGEHGLCEISDPVRREADAREVREDAEKGAEVVWRLDFCWRRGGDGADCVGDEKVRKICVELHFGCQRRKRAWEGERLYCDVLPEGAEGAEHRAAQDARQVIGQQKGVAALMAVRDAPQFIGMSTTYL